MLLLRKSSLIMRGDSARNSARAMAPVKKNTMLVKQIMLLKGEPQNHAARTANSATDLLSQGGSTRLRVACNRVFCQSYFRLNIWSRELDLTFSTFGISVRFVSRNNLAFRNKCCQLRHFTGTKQQYNIPLYFQRHRRGTVKLCTCNLCDKESFLTFAGQLSADKTESQQGVVLQQAVFQFWSTVVAENVLTKVQCWEAGRASLQLEMETVGKCRTRIFNSFAILI